MLLFDIVYSASCSPNNEICLTSTINGTDIKVAIAYKPFSGYLAFGYGGEKMTNQNMVFLMQGQKGLSADSYQSTTFALPKKVTNTWKIVSSSDSEIVITGTDSKYPTDSGTVVYASSSVVGGVPQQHTNNVGSFSITVTKYSPPKAAPKPVNSDKNPSLSESTKNSSGLAEGSKNKTTSNNNSTLSKSKKPLIPTVKTINKTKLEVPTVAYNFSGAVTHQLNFAELLVLMTILSQ
eukprot:NODE_583_length_6431_cov_0.491788.p3 type:complete len:236 gc:universal NODE_583_length_6431_cov_0.491788:4961-5668(+)